MAAELLSEWDTRDGFRGVSTRLETGQVMSVARHAADYVFLSWDIDGDKFGPADFLNRVDPRLKDKVSVLYAGGLYRPRLLRGMLLTYQVTGMKDVTLARVDEKGASMLWEQYQFEGEPRQANLATLTEDWETSRQYARKLGAMEVANAVPDALSFIGE